MKYFYLYSWPLSRVINFEMVWKGGCFYNYCCQELNQARAACAAWREEAEEAKLLAKEKEKEREEAVKRKTEAEKEKEKAKKDKEDAEKEKEEAQKVKEEALLTCRRLSTKVPFNTHALITHKFGFSL